MKGRALALAVIVVLATGGIGSWHGPVGVAAADAQNLSTSDLNGSGTSSDPYQITNASELQAMEDELDAYYELTADVDASGTADWNSGDGFKPIGDSLSPFTGGFDGNEHAIRNLTINRSNNVDVGLFGSIGDGGSATNVTLEDVNVTGKSRTGGIAGWVLDNGTANQSSVTGTIVGDIDTASGVGGIAGRNNGTIRDSNASVNVTGYSQVGGLVGDNEISGTVRESNASGTVTGTLTYVGGLIGMNCGTVKRADTNVVVDGDIYVGGLVAYARESSTIDQSSANVTVNGSTLVGGIVGENNGDVTSSAVTGEVNGSDHVGGLIGENTATATVKFSNASSDVTASNKYVGGLVGENDGIVNTSSATGTVTGRDYVGGLVGKNLGVMNTSNATNSVNGSSRVGGLIGMNAGTGSVTFSNASGTVTASNDYVGGLIGENEGTVTASGANGNVTGSGQYVGGLLGDNAGTVIGSDANSTVDGTDRVGGLVGYVGGSSIINDSAARGTVNGSSMVGGLIGYSWSSRVNQSYATGDVNGSDSVGGLIGESGGESTVRSSYAQGNVTGSKRYVGGLIGENEGTVIDADASGNVTGSNMYVGGLIGENGGTVTDTFANGTVDGTTIVGGLIGQTGGTSIVNQSAAMGDVNGTGPVGGLVGKNLGVVNTSMATGDVNGTNTVGGLTGENTATATVKFSNASGTVTASNKYVGGLVGENMGTVTASYASGNVTGSDKYVGGAIGEHEGTVIRSYANGTVTGTEHVGGLVGRSWDSTVRQSYATAPVTGSSNVGGLVGFVHNTTIEEAFASGAVDGTTNVGGAIGYDDGSTVVGTYWDRETTGQLTSAGNGTGLTTDEMIGDVAKTNMNALNFTGVWDVLANTTHESYPYLQANVQLPEPGLQTADTTAPNITNFSVTNPAGQEVNVSFSSNESLADINASISGAENATLTETNFTESDSGGNYTYEATYAGSSDGTYTVTLENATDADGNDGASGESDSVTIDTTAPSISNFSVENPSGQDVFVSFNSTEQLSTITASISGAESATLTETNFTESDSGGNYTYEATYAGSSDGTYTVTLANATDGDGNDGATGQTGDVTIDTTAPSISNFSVANPSGQDVRVSIIADERLSGIDVAITGAETAALAEGSFTESVSGSDHTYETTYEGSTDGTYTVTLENATDSEGHDGANNEQASVTVETDTTTSTETTGGGGGGGVVVSDSTNDTTAATNTTLNETVDDTNTSSNESSTTNSTTTTDQGDPTIEVTTTDSGDAQNETETGDEQTDGEQSQPPDSTHVVIDATDVEPETTLSVNTTEPATRDRLASVSQVNMTYDGDPNFTMQIAHHRTRPQSGVQSYAVDDVNAPLQYISIEQTFQHAAVSNSELRIRVDRARLDALGVSPEDVSIGRYSDGAWSNLSRDLVSVSDRAAVYEVNKPDSKLIGVTAAHPAMFVESIDPTPETAAVEQPVTIITALSNQGELAGTVSVRINEAGASVTTRSVWLAPGTVDTVSLRRTFEIPGTYTFTAGNETTDVTVLAGGSGDTTTAARTTADGSTARGTVGLPLGLLAGGALVVVVGSVLFVWWRRKYGPE